MTGIRDELAEICDEARADIDALGLRVRAVAVVAVTKVDDPSSLLPTTTSSTLVLTPRPRVRASSLWTGGEAGRIEHGDLVVERLSLTYTREQLDPGGDGHWTVDGQPYRLVSLEEGTTQWVARLRRITRNA